MNTEFFLPAFVISKAAFWAEMNLKLKYFFTEMIILAIYLSVFDHFVGLALKGLVKH